MKSLEDQLEAIVALHDLGYPTRDIAHKLDMTPPTVRKYLKIAEEHMPTFSHCDICGKPLPEADKAKGAANCEACWKQWVEENRAESTEYRALRPMRYDEPDFEYKVIK